MKKNYMSTNVILTFESLNEFGDSQEIFDLHLPISKDETDAISFLNKTLFRQIEAACEFYGRRKEDLWKISTASNWSIFKSITGKKSLPDLNHSCKWFFNENMLRLSKWEKSLKKDYQFGINT